MSKWTMSHRWCSLSGPWATDPGRPDRPTVGGDLATRLLGHSRVHTSGRPTSGVYRIYMRNHTDLPEIFLSFDLKVLAVESSLPLPST